VSSGRGVKHYSANQHVSTASQAFTSHQQA